MTCNACKLAEMECDCDEGPCADCTERLYGPPEATTMPAPFAECDFARIEARALAGTIVQLNRTEAEAMLKQFVTQLPALADFLRKDVDELRELTKPNDLVVLDVVGTDVRTLVDTYPMRGTGRTCH